MHFSKSFLVQQLKNGLDGVAATASAAAEQGITNPPFRSHYNGLQSVGAPEGTLIPTATRPAASAPGARDGTLCHQQKKPFATS
jgi:hypothetical protein